MPPASLSTFAVMKPGPMTARNISRRIRQTLTRRVSGMIPRNYGEMAKNTQNKRMLGNVPVARTDRSWISLSCPAGRLSVTSMQCSSREAI